MIHKTLTYSSIFILLLALYACPQEEHVDVDTTTITKHDANGNLIMEVEKSKSTGKGIFRFYYPDGTLQKIQEVINDSVEHGTYKYYYPSGVLEDSAQLSHGKFHGNRYEYFENGMLRKKGLYINDKVRNEIEYDSTGVLKEYWAGNYGDILNFVTYFDENENYDRTEGNLVNSVVLEESYPIGKPFSIEILVGQPPMFETSVWVGYRNKGDSEFKELFSGKPDRFNRVSYSLTQNPDKDIEILNVAKAVNKDAVISDTLTIKVGKDGNTTSYYSE